MKNVRMKGKKPVPILHFSPLKIICGNLKTGVITHPKHGEIVLNDAYLTFAEYYQAAVMPAEVRKPKQKASVEGSAGKTAGKIIGLLRNETFCSLEALNRGIREALDKLNSKEFQKRNGSRKIIFETEEKPMLRALPLMPFEICEWSYNHKVGPNSHIWFDKGQYSVPGDYLNRYVDVRYNNAMIYIYSSHKLIAEHKRLPADIKNGKRTKVSHLPYPLYMICSLYASVQGINNSPFLPHRALHGLQLLFNIYLIYLSKNLYKTIHNPIGKPNSTPPIKTPIIN